VGNSSHARRQVRFVGVRALAAMAILLHPLSPGEALEGFTCSAGTDLIVIGTLWLGAPNPFSVRLRRDLIGITFVAAASNALLMAALES